MASNKDNTESVPSEEHFEGKWKGSIFGEKYRAVETMRGVLIEIDLWEPWPHPRSIVIMYNAKKTSVL